MSNLRTGDGRKKYNTASAKKRAQNATQKRRDLTRIFLCEAYGRWAELRDQLKLNNSQLANLLLDR